MDGEPVGNSIPLLATGAGAAEKERQIMDVAKTIKMLEEMGGLSEVAHVSECVNENETPWSRI